MRHQISSVQANTRFRMPLTLATSRVGHQGKPAPNPAIANSTSFLLRSMEGTLHPADAHLLRQYSGLFDTILSLPAPMGGENQQIIDVFEVDASVQLFFDLLEATRLDLSYRHKIPLQNQSDSGRKHPSWTTSLDDLQALLEICEKWDCPALIHRVRIDLCPRMEIFPQSPSRRSSLIQTLADIAVSLSPHVQHTILHQHPLQIFAIARYFRWIPEARWISHLTLQLDFSDPQSAKILCAMAPGDAERLLDLRRRRVAMFKKMLDCPKRFPGGNS